ncbi:hypothetical protein QFZ48_000137 [Chitinophaga sp. W2I13]|uniref:hypothetical protein n=1 Tax=Chitinophaga sp. W2I13 TaxID=3373923 RepID=UPI003D258E3B
MRMIVGGKNFGDYKKSQEIQPFLDAMESILTAGDDLYDTSFATASQQEIFSMVLVLDAEVGEWTDSDYDQLDRYERFTFFCGEQFSNVSAVVYNREGVCNFIWSMSNNLSIPKIDNLKNLYSESIPLSVLALTIKSSYSLLININPILSNRIKNR